MYFEPNEKPNAPVAYMERTRLYYRALGYQKDYTWAHHDAVPFAQLKQAVTESTATIITTSNPPGGPPQGNSKLKEVWSDLIDTAPADLNTDNLAWDHEATHTRDRESYLPINALQNLAAAGRIGGLSARFHGVPTTYSQRQTLVEDAPEVLRRCRADGSDIAFLVPL
jgi:D-proline reductase (dithiol) PrdB